MKLSMRDSFGGRSFPFLSRAALRYWLLVLTAESPKATDRKERAVCVWSGLLMNACEILVYADLRDTRF